MTTPYPFVSGAVLTAQQLNDIQNLPISDKTASYVLDVNDAYKRTMMNSASATTITVNNSIFTVGDVIQVANKGAGVCTVTAGAGVTINTSGSLALAQYGGGYLLCLSASTFTFFNLGGGANYGAATGGTGVTNVTIGGVNYAYTSFTSSGVLTNTKAGLFDCLIFSGGGGGGGAHGFSGYSGGGGGAGGVSLSTIYLSANLTVTIGAGGAGSTSGTVEPSLGSSSSIGNTIQSPSVAGGGTGAGLGGRPLYPARAGGAGGGGGGGAANAEITGAPGMAPNISGYAGGNGIATASQASGGGGGSGVIGSNASGTTGGAGGAGYDVSAFIGGSALLKGGGGGGGGATGGAGGSSIGGAGGGTNANGSNAAANTASGGGGSGTSSSNSGGNGGSGIVYIRWKV
jgi:hypothetical protein